MGFSWTSRWALFLCLLMINQQFIIASHAYHHVDVTRTRRTIMPYQHDGDDDAEYSGSDDDVGKKYSSSSGQSVVTFGSHRNATSGIAQHQRAQKRLFGIVLFVFAVLVTAAAVTVETIYDIHGCCGLSYNLLCNFEKRFNDRKRVLTVYAKELDKRIDIVASEKKRLDDFYEMMEKAQKEIEKIVDLKSKILDAIDNNIKLNLKTQIESITNKAEQTSKGINGMTLAEIEKKIDRTVQRNVQLFLTWTLGVGVLGIEPIAKRAYKSIKINRIYKVLKAKHALKVFNAAPKAQKLLGFTDDAVKAFLKATAIARYGSKVGKAAKVFKIAKVAGVVMSLVGIGVDLYNIINTFMQCKKKQDGARDALRKLVEAENRIDESQKQLNTFRVKLEGLFRRKVIPDLRNKKFHDALEGVISTMRDTEESVINRGHTWMCQGDILRFIREMKQVTHEYEIPRLTEDLARIIAICMKPVTISLTCQLKKVKIEQRVLDDCRGGAGNFSQIFAKQSKSYNNNDCKDRDGNLYVTEKGMKLVVVRSAADEDFDPECLSNSATIRAQVCKYKKDKKSESEIGKLVNLRKSKVLKIIKECADELSPKQKSKICMQKRLEVLTNQDIAEVFKVSVKSVQGLKCKVADQDLLNLNPGTAKKICMYKRHDGSTSWLARELRVSDKVVEKLKCQTSEMQINPRDKIFICQLKKFGVSDKDIAGAFGVSVEQVEDVTCP